MTIHLVYTMAMLVITMDVIHIYIYIYMFFSTRIQMMDGCCSKKPLIFPKCDSFLQIALYSPQVNPKIC